MGDADRLVAANASRARPPRRATTAPTPARIAVIPCGVDTALFAPADAGGRPRRARLSTPARCCSTWGGSRPIKGLTHAARRHGAAARGRPPARPAHRGRRRRRAAERARGRAARRLDRPSASATPCRFVGAQPQERLRDLVRRRRRHRAAVVLRVVRHGRAGGDGVRQPGGRLTSGRAADDRARRRHRRAGARARRRAPWPTRSSTLLGDGDAARAPGPEPACAGPRSTAGPAWPSPSAASTPARRCADDLSRRAGRCRIESLGGLEARQPPFCGRPSSVLPVHPCTAAVSGDARATLRELWASFSKCKDSTDPLSARAAGWCARWMACRGTSRRARRSRSSASRAAARS